MTHVPPQTAVDHSELGALDAVETATRIRSGELKASEAVSAAIERARTLEPALNAIPTPTFDTATRESEQPGTGPFAGVPTFVKGLDDQAGVVNDYSSVAYRDHVARRTEPYVQKYLQTGLISLGHSAAPEIGLSGATEPLAHGATRNPWQLAHSTGGSSGGAAALVAARVVALAHGSDAGGSIRIPAGSCGLVGLKPSRGRRFEPARAPFLPVRGVTYGALSRTVRDSAHFIAAMEELIPGRKLAPIGRVDGPARRRLRIAVFTASPLGGEVHPEAQEATVSAAELCRDLGHTVNEISCPYDAQIIEDSWRYFGFLAWAFIGVTRLRKRGRFEPAEFEPWTRGLADHFRSQLGATWAGVRRLRKADRVSARVFADCDALLCPTLAGPAPEIGLMSPDLPFEVSFERQMHHFPFTPIQNATGDPAISLPLAVASNGLPLGVQFAAAHGGEAMLLGLAYELEATGAFRNAIPAYD
jgi:amidase